VKNVDIRQLALWCALIDTQSLTLAAQRLGVTPSAASQGLSRLRTLMGDALVERRGGRYELTPFGEAAIGPARQIVALWQGMGRVAQPPDLARCRVDWVLVRDAALSGWQLARALAECSAVAPGLRVEVKAVAAGACFGHALGEGRADLALGLGGPVDAPAGIERCILGTLAWTHCVLAVDHPRIDGTLTLARYLAEEHLVWHDRLDPIDAALTAAGEGPRRTRHVDSWPTAAELLAHTGRLLTTHVGEAQRMLAWSPSLRCLPLPREVVSPALPLHLAWHRRWQADPVHRWLRERLADALRPPPVTVAGV